MLEIPLAFSLNPPAVPSAAFWSLATLPDASPARPSSASKLVVPTSTLDFLDPRLLSLVAFCRKDEKTSFQKFSGASRKKWNIYVTYARYLFRTHIYAIVCNEIFHFIPLSRSIIYKASVKCD